MICPNCNEQVPVGTKFCPSCGTQLPQEEKTRGEIAREEFPKLLEEKAKGSLKLFRVGGGAKNVFVGDEIPREVLTRFEGLSSAEKPIVLFNKKRSYWLGGKYTGLLFTDKKLHFIAYDVRCATGFLFALGKTISGNVLLRAHKFTLGDEINVNSYYSGNEFYIDGNFKGWVHVKKPPITLFDSADKDGEIFCLMLFNFINKFNEENPVK